MRLPNISECVFTFNRPAAIFHRYPYLPDCGDVPEDGNGVPEQVGGYFHAPIVSCLAWSFVLTTAIRRFPFRKFWNCAEIKVVRADDKVHTSVSDPHVSEVSDVAASEEACADVTHNYSEAIEDCTGYTYCMMGKPTRKQYCREGMLYDQTEQKCKYADEVACGGRPVQDGDASHGLESAGANQSIGVSSSPEEEPLLTSDNMLATSEEIQGGSSSDILTDMINALDSVKDDLDNKIFLYQTPDFQWVPSTVYRYEDFSESLDVMATEGVAGKKFYIGESAVGNGLSYGLVNIAAFLAQSMKET
jgi:hypothetical protein